VTETKVLNVSAVGAGGAGTQRQSRSHRLLWSHMPKRRGREAVSAALSRQLRGGVRTQKSPTVVDELIEGKQARDCFGSIGFAGRRRRRTLQSLVSASARHSEETEARGCFGSSEPTDQRRRRASNNHPTVGRVAGPGAKRGCFGSSEGQPRSATQTTVTTTTAQTGTTRVKSQLWRIVASNGGGH
jgi:hypothetical protein